MNKDKRNNIKLLGTLNNADESGIIANANQIYDANEDKSTQDVSKEHTERIKDLETKKAAMQTTLENITKTGEASAASNVTYNHSDSKLDATNVQQAIDEVRKKSNYNDGDNIIDFNTIHLITDNPEFACVAVDVDDKILYGIKTDGQPYFGVGCPKQVKDYIDKQINKILGTDDITATIDSLKEIETFLKDFTNSDTLKNLLDLKANVDEVRDTTDDIYKKSNPNDDEGNVVDTNTIVSVEDNPEYIKALTDSVGKLIEAIGLDGVRKFFAGINIQGVSQCVTDNPEYIVAWLDSQDRIIFAIENDGNPYFGYGVPKQINGFVEDINAAVYSKIDELTQSLENVKTDIDKKIKLGDAVYPSNVYEITDNSEYISAIVDKANKLLEAYGVDGIKRIFTAVEICDTLINTKDNSEFFKVEIDNAGKLLESTDFNGKKYIYGELVLHDILYGIISNAEYLSAILDKDNKILEGYTKDGVKKIYSPIEVLGIKKDIAVNDEYESLDISKNGKIISGVFKDGTNYFPLAKDRQSNIISKIYKSTFR